jgi:predicted HicB family RNase H-like nuclease
MTSSESAMNGYRLKRIIKGKTYNTETATVVFECFNDHPSMAGVVLYQTRHGEFFKLSVEHDGEEDSFGPLTDAEAQAFLEKIRTTKATEALEQYFGPFPEGGAAETRWTIRIPGNLAARVEAAAKASGMSINTYAMRCFERSVATDGTSR